MNNIKRGEASRDSPNTTAAHILLHKDRIEVITTAGAQPGRARGAGHCIAYRIARDAVDS